MNKIRKNIRYENIRKEEYKKKEKIILCIMMKED